MRFNRLPKKIVRVIAMISAILVTASFVSFSAFATDSGIAVEIIDIEAPVAGNLPDYDGTIVGDFYDFYTDGGYTINGITWYNLTDDTNVDNETYFEDGKIYKVSVLIVPKGNNAWVLESAEINGETAEVSEADDCYIISYTFGEYVYVDTDGVVEITGITEPVAGATPDYSVEFDSEFFELYKDDFGYVYDGVTWFDTTAQSNLDTTDVFLGNHIYMVSILLNKREGCEVELTSVTINGKEAPVYDAEDYYIISYTFVECADTVIRGGIELELRREPVAGMVPCYEVYINDDRYELNYDKNNVYYHCGVCWFDVTEGTNLIIGEDKFIEGHTYQLEIYLVPDEYYTFNLTSATVNSKEAEIWGGNKSVVIICEFAACKAAEGVVRGNVTSTRNFEDNDITIELYEATREELFWSTTIYENTYDDYYIDEVPPGEYVMVVNKAEHVERKYYLSIEDKSVNSVDIYIAKKGDCDMDGEIDVVDYQSVVNTALCNMNYVPYYTTEDYEYRVSLSDYAEDGYVDAIDCAAIAVLARDSRSYDCVEVTGLTLPVAGQLPTYTASIEGGDYEIYKEESGYVYDGIAWYDLTIDSNLDKTDAFEEGHTYSVTIEIIPSNGGEWDLKYAILNGELVKAKETAVCYLVTFVFEI